MMCVLDAASANPCGRGGEGRGATLDIMCVDIDTLVPTAGLLWSVSRAS